MFGKKKEEPVIVVLEPQKEEAAATNKTVIAKGVAMIGDFEGIDPIEINGTIKGTLDVRNSVVIAENGKLMGNGSIQDLTVSGSVDGDFICKDIALFKAGGEMTGHLTTSRLQTEDGSHFKGSLTLAENEAPKFFEEPEAPAPAEEPPKPAEETSPHPEATPLRSF